jgi:hypothetical protein
VLTHVRDKVGKEGGRDAPLGEGEKIQSLKLQAKICREGPLCGTVLQGKTDPMSSFRRN